MTQRIKNAIEQYKPQILSFAQEVIRTKSITCNEGAVASLIENKMKELGFDNVHTDKTGNVIGSLGCGKKNILFDGHMDTVGVIDEADWDFDPFEALIVDGKLTGRGSVDMKGSLVISIFAAVIAQALNLLEGKKIYVVGSVMEEDFDGVAVHNMLQDLGDKIDYAVFGEATGMKIGRGHNGRALIEIKVNGKAAHGSHPELGDNPVYKMQKVVDRVEKLAENLYHRTGEHGSLALTNVHCKTASNNSVPESASIILDRRLAIGENMSTIEKELEYLLADVDGSWSIVDVPGTSWKGANIMLHSFLSAWEIPEDSELVLAAKKATKNVLGFESECVKLGYTTDAVSTAGELGIPTLILGAGDTAYAHGKNEFCPINELLLMCETYVHLCAYI